MAAIAVFGGTAEGRQLAEGLKNSPLQVHISVATAYGASLLPQAENIHIHTGRMEAAEMASFFAAHEIDCCLDATHSYAAIVTQNIYQACTAQKVEYLRIGRSVGEEVTGDSVCYVESVAQAAAFLNSTEGNILITTGSKELAAYTTIEGYRSRCFARVLPLAQVVEDCAGLGFEGRNLIGMQGPFSEEMNRCMIRQVGAKWLVTKQSGTTGGYPEKCEAALKEGIGLVIVGRPTEPVSDTLTVTEALDFLQQKYGFLPSKQQVWLMAAGMGSEDGLTVEARRCLQQCDVIIAPGRVLQSCRKLAADKPFLDSYKGEEIAAFLHSHPEYRRAVVAFSGDIGFYSGAGKVRSCLQDFEVHAVPGIASPVYFMDKLGISWEDAVLASCHGRECKVLPLVRSHRKVVLLLGRETDPSVIAKSLSLAGLGRVKMTVGQRLSYPDEEFVSGYPEEMKECSFASLSVLLLENPQPRDRQAVPGIEDDCFVRGKVPMTKEEIRVLSLSKLQLRQDSVVYDIGAGTGSVSVEAALLCREGRVYAIEKKPEAAELLAVNKAKFGADAMELVNGEAPACLEELEPPTHVFIGGSSGQLSEIIRAVRRKNKQARFVVNAVTLETMGAVTQLAKEFPEYEDMEIIQVNVSRTRALGRYHLMQAENPVLIASFGGEKQWQR